MITFDPQQIADWTDGLWLNALEGQISGFCFDARQIQPGQCFVALSGGARDGHDFIEQAAQSGAVAALVETPKDLGIPQLQVADTLLAMEKIAKAVRAQFRKPVVGVSGSCGKTSTKEMLRGLLGGDRCHATAGNWNNRIGVPMTLFGLSSAQHDFAVIEAGINQPKEMRHLGRMIQADLTIITNVGPAHLELLGSLENIALEKCQLAQEAKSDSAVILPVSVLEYSAFAGIADRVIALVSDDEQSPGLDVRETVHYHVEPSSCGRSQTLKLSGVSYNIASASRGIAVNAALAITAASRLGISSKAIQPQIEAWRPSEDRGRIEAVGEQTFYIDCYNANPASMKDAMSAFVQTTPQDVARLYILGAMNELGEFAEAEHEKSGQQLRLRTEDRACFVGPASLTAAYSRGAIASGASEEQLVCAENFEIIKSIVADFKGAIFLKGSRSYQLEKLVPENLKL